MSSDDLINFEESNYDTLVDKFLNIKQVRGLWSDFVYNEYEKNLNDEPSEDR